MLTQSYINTIEAKTMEILSIVYGSLDKVLPPVSLDMILKTFHIKLKGAEFKDQAISGAYDRTNRTIYVASDESLNRQAFSVAHELGHYFLHEKKKTDLFYRSQILNLSGEQPREEKEANIFAASLLMPEYWVKHYYALTKDLNKLAIIFGVSITAVDYRLRDLGLIE